MPTKNTLYKKQLAINDSISIVIPTVGAIIDDEDTYYNLVSILTAMPIDFMVLLDDAGIDFTTINAYQMFLMLFKSIQSKDTSLIFGDLDMSKFEMAVNEQNGQIVLLDKEHDIVIDRAIHGQIAGVLRKIHHLEKNRRKPANDEAKKYIPGGVNSPVRAFANVGTHPLFIAKAKGSRARQRVKVEFFLKSHFYTASHSRYCKSRVNC